MILIDHILSLRFQSDILKYKNIQLYNLEFFRTLEFNRIKDYIK